MAGFVVPSLGQIATVRNAMAYETLLYDVKDGIAVITLNRPQVLNALNRQLIGELDNALVTARADASVHVVIITGAGDKAFAAGADIAELAELGPLTAIDTARKGQALTRLMEELGKPVLAAVNGFALGGGCELAMAATLRVASETAKFGQPEVNLGVIPGYGGTQRLSRLIGKGRAMDLILTGRTVGATEALNMGLVNMVVPPTDLMDATRKLAGTLMQKGPIALRLAIQAVDGGLEMGMDAALEWEAHLFGVCASTADMKEGLAAFLEKRRAAFQGR
jgi:enoyl-CoA hydratase